MAPSIGSKTLTERPKKINDVHGLLYMSYGFAPFALSNRDLVYHKLESPNSQELS